MRIMGAPKRRFTLQTHVFDENLRRGVALANANYDQAKKCTHIYIEQLDTLFRRVKVVKIARCSEYVMDFLNLHLNLVVNDNEAHEELLIVYFDVTDLYKN